MWTPATTTTLTALALLARLAAAQSSATAPSSAGTGVPSITISTAIASASAPSAPLPSQVDLPPEQAWCPSKIFCAGKVLQWINSANLFADPKTVVDKPTSKPSQEVLAAFNALGDNPSTGAIENFVEANFRGEGLELEALALPQYKENPSFLNGVADPVIRAWSQRVHSYWTQLTRGTNQTALCPSNNQGGPCESSLIPLNHTFVVPGGRFREQYYWDSYWILQGLLESELYNVANQTLQNFMDEIATFGFIPNGGRIYYLDRSQPPLFIRMLSDYVSATNDTAILRRGFPIAEAELRWWATNRALSVTSPFTNQTHTVFRYAVNNSAPRPESYLQDYTTANMPDLPALNASARADLYAELASGAETGWDYTVRWFADPTLAGDAGLRTLRIRDTIPICLNSILYNAHTSLARLYSTHGSLAPSGTNAQSRAANLTSAANALRAGVLDLLWDGSKLAYYDYHVAEKQRSSFFSVANFYPLWSGIVPPEVLANATNAFGHVSSLNLVLRRYNGTYPTTFVVSGQQWDAPNAWPPHQHIVMGALEALPANLTSGALPTPAAGQGAFSLIPAGQLGLDESALPAQPLYAGKNASQSGAAADVNALNGTVVNGGNATAGEGWAATLRRELANRYIASALCSWRATGGSIPDVLPRLSDKELNVTQSVNNTGNMFEKFSNTDIDSAGRGGEYTVQAGFGWTNGVALAFAGKYGDVLVAPQCPDLLASAAADGGSGGSGGGSSAAGGSGSSAAGRTSAASWTAAALAALAAAVVV